MEVYNIYILHVAMCLARGKMRTRSANFVQKRPGALQHMLRVYHGSYAVEDPR